MHVTENKDNLCVLVCRTGTHQQLPASVDDLVGCLTARQHREVDLCQLQGGKLAQAAKDGQCDTMHITLRYTITM